MSANRPSQPAFGTKSAATSTRIERLRHRIRAARVFDEIASGNLAAPTPWDDCAEEADWRDERDADYRAELDRDARSERGNIGVALAIFGALGITFVGILSHLSTSLTAALGAH